MVSIGAEIDRWLDDYEKSQNKVIARKKLRGRFLTLVQNEIHKAEREVKCQLMEMLKDED